MKKNISRAQRRAQELLRRRNAQKNIQTKTDLPNTFKTLRDKLLNFLKKNTLRISLRFYIFLGIAVVFVFLSKLLAYQNSGFINGDIVLLGNTSFSYDSPQVPRKNEERISPLCGCILNHPHRGVQFFSKHFFVKPKFKKDTTFGPLYLITSPAQNMYPDPYFYFKSKIVFVKGPLYEDEKQAIIFNSFQDSLDIDTPKVPYPTKKIIREINTDKTTFISLLNNRSDLDIQLLSQFPIAALIPLQNSIVNVKKDPLTNFNDNEGYELREIFETKKMEDKFEVPMIDMVGPKIAIESQPEAVSVNNDFIKFSPLDGEVTCLIILKTGFSTRISVANTVPKSIHLADSIRGPALTDLNDGEVAIKPNPLNNDEFQDLRKLITKTGLFNSPQEIIGSNYEYASWGLPDISPYNGIYFYGQNLSRISCDEALGSCQFESKTIDLTPSRKMEITDLKNFRFNDEPIITPLNYEKSSNFQTKFKGQGKLYIDGQLVAKSFLDNELINRFAMILGIIVGLISLIQIIYDLFKGKKSV